MSGLNKYNEISETIKSDIFNGRLKENMALPSIRRLAQYYNVNPATIVRALKVLREQKLIYNKRTTGFYVCSDILKIREEMAREVILGFLQDMSKIGYSKLEIQQLLKGGAKWESDNSVEK